MSEYQYNPNVEQWKEIPGFPGYEISDHGQVRSYWRRSSRGYGKGGMFVREIIPQINLKQSLDKDGYLRVSIRTPDGKGNILRIHRVVLQVFEGPCLPKHEACHNDGNRTNNIITNLRWDSRFNNHCDRYKHGTAPIGINNGAAKLDESQVKEIRILHSLGYLNTEIASLYELTPRAIGLIVLRKTWPHVP